MGILSIPSTRGAMGDKQIRERFSNLRRLYTNFNGSPKKLDFLIVTLPCRVFREDSYIQLFRCVYDLLQSRYSVHLKRVSFAEHGITHDGTWVILLASSVCCQAPWEEPPGERVAKAVLKDRIRDLAFKSPRRDEDNFICRHPRTGEAVYNHNTGRKGQSRPLDWNSVVSIGQLPLGAQRPVKLTNASSSTAVMQV